MIGPYRIITLCGSTRFRREFEEVQKKLTLEGNIVISVGLFGHSGDSEVWEGMDEGTLTKTKEMLDDIINSFYVDAGVLYTKKISSFHQNMRTWVGNNRNTVASMIKATERVIGKQLTELNEGMGALQ